MAVKMHPKGTKLSADMAGTTTFVAIADVAGVMPPNLERRPAKTTHLESTSDYDEFIPGWKDGGEITFRLRFHKTQWGVLNTAFDSDVIPNWKVTFPMLTGETVASSWASLGILTKLGQPERSVDDDDPWEVEGTIKVTGKPTFTAGT